MGQKKRFVRELKNVLKHFDSATVFVDLFGGSGLLSHVTKHERPDATVIYNDYDNFRERIDNVERTNALLADLRSIIGNHQREKILGSSPRAEVLARVKKDDSFDELDNGTPYNKVRKEAYNCAGIWTTSRSRGAITRNYTSSTRTGKRSCSWLIRRIYPPT
jgi:hypothetical protein